MYKTVVILFNVQKQQTITSPEKESGKRHNHATAKLSLRNFGKPYSYVGQSWIPRSARVCQHTNGIKHWLHQGP